MWKCCFLFEHSQFIEMFGHELHENKQMPTKSEKSIFNASISRTLVQI